jgi:hypothetical protein
VAVPLALACVGSWLVCPAAGAGLLTFDQLVPARPQTPHPAVARIIVPEQGAVSHGSGTLVDVHGDYGLIVTNWHVVRDSAGDVVVQFPDGFRSAGRVLKVDQDWDLAVLAIWRPPAKPMPLASAPPHPGDVLTIAGYGQGQYREATGQCTQYVAPGADLPYEMVEVSASARQGDSGGPIINQRGELAGVLFGSTRHATSGSYVGRVRWFLASISQHVRSYSEAIAQSERTRDQLAAARAGTSDRAYQPPPTDEPGRIAAPARIDASSVAASEVDPTGGAAAPPPPQAPEESVHQPIPRPTAAQTASLPREKVEVETVPISISWQQLAGDSTWEQTKSVLAVIGIWAIIYQLARRNNTKA